MVREWTVVEEKGGKEEVKNMGKGKKKKIVYCYLKLAFILSQSIEISTKFHMNVT